MMKRNRILALLLALLLIAGLTACGGTPAAEPDGETDAEPAAEAAATVLECSGKTLTIPAEYAELLIAEATGDTPDGTLFTVSEKASVEAAKKQGGDDWGAGWLFGIVCVSEAEAQTMRCSDMSGAEIFAKDENGNCYIYTHPTDVRITRDGNITEEDMKQWSALNEWAASVRDAFIKDNAGLEPVSFGNSEVDIYLAQIAFAGEKYLVSTTEFGPMEPKDVDPAPFLDKLMNGVRYEYLDGEAPDGEYVVLQLPEQDVRLDFYPNNVVRRVYMSDNSLFQLYKATFDDGKTDASAVMQEWYDALKVNR